MSLSISQWHQRYLQQARWTQSLRAYIYRLCGIHQAHRILDVGCGTGVLEHELTRQTESDLFGVDKDFSALRWSQKYAPKPSYATADCLSLPFSSSTFDVVLCHFLLLWINGPELALSEMVRVTHSGGFVVALAEPDYGGRIDFPTELTDLGKWQIEALKRQDADPFTGRKIRSLFMRQGLLEVETGILGGQWREMPSEQEVELEWQVLESDLVDDPKFIEQAEKYKALEYSAQRAQHRILYVPVFYALGKVP